MGDKYNSGGEGAKELAVNSIVRSGKTSTGKLGQKYEKKSVSQKREENTFQLEERTPAKVWDD